MHLGTKLLVPGTIRIHRLSGGRDDEVGLQDEAQPIGAQRKECKHRLLMVLCLQAEGQRHLHSNTKAVIYKNTLEEGAHKYYCARPMSLNIIEYLGSFAQHQVVLSQRQSSARLARTIRVKMQL